MPKLIIKIEDEKAKLIQDDDVCCYIVSADLDQKYITQIVSCANEQNKLVLIEGNNATELCLSLNLDGVIVNISGSEKVETELIDIRKKIGARKVLGVICRNRRHEIMLVGETEPEFVILNVWNDGKEKVKELISWYNELFLIQLALNFNDKELEVSEFDADFVILNDQEYKILVAKNKRLD